MERTNSTPAIGNQEELENEVELLNAKQRSATSIRLDLEALLKYSIGDKIFKERLEQELEAMLKSDLKMDNIIRELRREIQRNLEEYNLAEKDLNNFIKNLETSLKEYQDQGLLTIVRKLEEDLDNLNMIKQRIEKLKYLEEKWNYFGVKLIPETPREKLYEEAIRLLEEENLSKEDLKEEINMIRKDINHFREKNEGNLVDHLEKRLKRLEHIQERLNDAEYILKSKWVEISKTMDLNERGPEEILERLSSDIAFFEEHHITDLIPYLKKFEGEFEAYHQGSKTKTKETELKISDEKAFKTISRYTQPPNVGWGYAGSGVDAIDIKPIQKDLNLVGVGFFMPTSETDVNNIELKISERTGGPAPTSGLFGQQPRNNTESNPILQVSNIEVRQTAGENLKIFKYHFGKSLVLKQGVLYTIQTKTRSSQSYAGKGGQSLIRVSEDFDVEFQKSSADSNGTRVENGQIPEIYFIE